MRFFVSLCPQEEWSEASTECFKGCAKPVSNTTSKNNTSVLNRTIVENVVPRPGTGNVIASLNAMT